MVDRGTKRGTIGHWVEIRDWSYRGGINLKSYAIGSLRYGIQNFEKIISEKMDNVLTDIFIKKERNDHSFVSFDRFGSTSINWYLG